MTSSDSVPTSCITRSSMRNSPAMYFRFFFSPLESALRVSSASPLAAPSMFSVFLPPLENASFKVATYSSKATNAPSTALFSSLSRSRSVSYSGMATSAGSSVDPASGCSAGRVEVGAATGELSAQPTTETKLSAEKTATNIWAGRRCGRDDPVLIPRLCGLQLRRDPIGRHPDSLHYSTGMLFRTGEVESVDNSRPSACKHLSLSSYRYLFAAFAALAAAFCCFLKARTSCRVTSSTTSAIERRASGSP